ncbi:arsenate reductase [Ignatzschineria rhizosphaerae]|uniref:Arsenate reductase n=1 Tax=Ignatzschineria rhizosphaerae TaxID=2923279 RepID=A0ABY3X588_9GAMM|nr:ArsC/Spx/MgsR family protein [Ignatzschineria rhizosphaerae]UNM97445.1 arsenate reductase [Ignatzschineria rhizosphaerae]
MWQIYYNGNCSKARAAKAYLDEKQIAYDIINYLEAPLTPEMIKTLLGKLGIGIDGLVRVKEEAFKAIALEWFTWSDDEKIAFVIENPIVIERPVVVYDDHAVIARPDVAPIDHLLARAWK